MLRILIGPDNWRWPNTYLITRLWVLMKTISLFSSQGYYAYVEVSDPVRQGDVAYLETRDGLFDNFQGPFVIQFYYHMFGSETGTLTVTSNNDRSSTILLTQSGNGRCTFRCKSIISTRGRPRGFNDLLELKTQYTRMFCKVLDRICYLRH